MKKEKGNPIKRAEFTRAETIRVYELSKVYTMEEANLRLKNKILSAQIESEQSNLK